MKMLTLVKRILVDTDLLKEGVFSIIAYFAIAQKSVDLTGEQLLKECYHAISMAARIDKIVRIYEIEEI